MFVKLGKLKFDNLDSQKYYFTLFQKEVKNFRVWVIV